MGRGLLAAVTLVASTGCAQKLKDTEDVPVAAAWLEGFDVSTIAVVGGISDGDAILGYEDLDGAYGSLGVHIGGPVFGMVMDLTADPEWGSAVSFDLSDAEVDPVMLSDVLGTYKGSTASAAVGIGVETRNLHNKHGIQLDEDHLAFGIGLMAGWEWLRIREGGSEDGEDGDKYTLFGEDDTAAEDDTASSDDTAPSDDTAGSDDSSGSDDTGGSDDSGGPGSGSGSGNHPAPEPAPEASDDSSGGCGSGGNSSGTDGGCCCSGTNSMMIVGFWMLLGGRRRQKRNARITSN